MLKRIIDFFKVSQPSAEKLPADKADKQYKKLRFQTFVAGTLGYSLYYVCRTGLNVVKGPIIGEDLSFVFCGALVGLAGWQWGFMGSAIAGVIGVLIIIFFMHDTPESK